MVGLDSFVRQIPLSRSGLAKNDCAQRAEMVSPAILSKKSLRSKRLVAFEAMLTEN